jgi:flagellar assembly factor FliW
MNRKTAMKLTPTESIIRFEEGLIGFYDFKTFQLIESDEIAPFRWLQSTDRPEVGFLVIEPSLIVRDYTHVIPRREWESLGLTNPEAGVVLVMCMVGPASSQTTANLQAPLLVNFQKNIAKQVILTETGLTSRHPLI